MGWGSVGMRPHHDREETLWISPLWKNFPLSNEAEFPGAEGQPWALVVKTTNNGIPLSTPR